jgi:hypothetical protein
VSSDIDALLGALAIADAGYKLQAETIGAASSTELLGEQSPQLSPLSYSLIKRSIRRHCY